MPVAHGAMTKHLGALPIEPVHVVLSDAASHLARFKPRLDELIRVLDPGEAAEAQQDPAATAASYARGTYALGVATRISASQRPPSAAVQDELAIYLDLETAVQIARELGVDPLSLVATVLAHELAHCRRGHADSAVSSPTHGWLEEGDAQRDAWHILTELLADDGWTGVTYEARAAQLRLALCQPPAYRQFAVGAPEWGALAAIVAVPERQTWLLQPARRVYCLAAEGSVEVSVLDATENELPHPGDGVYLRDGDMLAGPWMLATVTDRPHVGRSPDVEAARNSWRSPSWWQLYGGSGLSAVRPEVYEDELTPLVPVKIDFVPVTWRLGVDAMEFARPIAERVKEERRAEFLEDYGEATRTNPALRAVFDRINGWEED